MSNRRIGWRARASAVAAILAVGTAGLVVAAQTSSAVTMQTGHINYAGPGPCPTGTSSTDSNGPSCIIVPAGSPLPAGLEQHAAVDPSDTATPDGVNTVDCRTDVCGLASTPVLQTGPVGSEITKPTNTASCTSSDGASDTAQLCNVQQIGGANTINANYTENPSTGATVSSTSVTQTSKQRALTSQNGDTNTLNVTLTISQSATSTINTSIPPTHTQRTLQLANNSMTANVSNTATYKLIRSQTSTVSGFHPTQLQDDTAGSEPDGATLGLAEVNLTANSAGTNRIQIRGADTKNETATAIDLGKPTQVQGHTTSNSTNLGAGIFAQLAVNSTNPNPGNLPDIDIGTAGQSDTGSNNGLFKNWTQTASGPAGASLSSKAQTQDDGLPVHILGQSPFFVTTNSSSTLKSDAGAFVLCSEDASGHTHVNWTGRLFCDNTAGTKHQSITVPFSAQQPNVSTTCQLNSDACGQSTTQDKPTSEAFLAVRNASAGESFTSGTYNAPAQTTASPGDTVEYQPTFHNMGDAGSSANNATLSMSVPSGTTFASCSGGCTQSGSTVTWNLGNVPGGAPGPYVSRTLDVTVNPSAAAGELASTATGADAQEAPFTSNSVSVIVRTVVHVTANGVSAVEGSPFSGQVATFTDNNAADGPSNNNATIDWGDGSGTTAGTIAGSNGAFTVSGTHTYADEGTKTVTVTVTNAADSTITGSSTSTATIGDAALTVTGRGAQALSGPSFSGVLANVKDANAAAPADGSDLSASINWGDGGQPTAGTLSSDGAGGWNVAGNHTYAPGTYTVKVTVTDKGGAAGTATTTVTSASCPSTGCFTIGDNNAAVNTAVEWWGGDWSTKNSLSGGAAPSSFKGFENTTASPPCSASGSAWSTTGGSSPPPAGGVPQYMLVVVTSLAQKSGSAISGNIVHLVIVKTNPGYSPATGGVGTGTVIATVC